MTTIDSPPWIRSEHGALSVVGLSAFDDNLIWVLVPDKPAVGGAVPVAVVDPGDAGPVLDFCRRSHAVPTSILLTHHHADHTGGVADIVDWMAQHYSEQPVRVYGPAVEQIPGVTDPLSGGEGITPFPWLLDIRLSVMDVAGHTRGHLAYLLLPSLRLKPAALFSGDLIFGLGCGRLFEGTAVQMSDALVRVSHLEDTTRIYCAHEYTLLNLPFALAVDPENAILAERGKKIRELRQQGLPTLPLLLSEEQATNPFLRCDQPALAEAVCADAEVGSRAVPVDVFTALRAMRDNFKAC
jgi:hydroxyacylglutathione hydrolase